VTEQSPQRLPRDDEPGGQSTPLDTAGDGPVGLEDRTSTDEKGSPATNQAKAEPIPPTRGAADPTAPLAPPLLEDMNVSAGDPQAPSHPLAAAGSGGGTPVDGPRAPQVADDAGSDRRPRVPASTTPGRSHRAPGLQGEPSPAESVETDVDDSAAAMRRDTGREAGAGQVHGVPVPSETPSPGTSEEHGAVQGARTPQAG
jgi:hypothetical protein